MSDTNSQQSDAPPKASEVLARVIVSSPAGEVSKSEEEYLKQFRRDSVEQQVRYAHLAGIQDHYRHKGRWSTFLMRAIAAMIGFQSVLLALVGWGIWDFSKYEWLLPALLVQNLAQVVGLSVWAVKYLFSDISRQRPE